MTAQLRRIAVAVGVAAVTLLAVRPLAAEPVRVATLLPYVADALARVPEQATIVASVQRVTGGPNSGGIDLGTAHQPNLELLAAARPTLVVADAHRHAALAPKLAIGGAEVLLLRGDSVEATLEAIRTVAERVGAGPQLGAEIARVRAELDQLRAAAPGSERVLPVFGAPGSFLVATDRTWWGDLLQRLGRESAAAEGLPESLPGYVQLSEEVLAAAQFDRVVLLAHGSPAIVARAFAADLARLGRADLPVEPLDPDLFGTNPGLRMVEAARALLGSQRGGAS